MPWIEKRRTTTGIVYWVFDRVNGKRVYFRAGSYREALSLKIEMRKRRELTLKQETEKQINETYKGVK